VLVEGFAAVVRGRHSPHWAEWMVRAKGSSAPELRTFARGLRRDEEKSQVVIEFPWNNGPVEGYVNRLKEIKRSMCGRARFDLPRACVLTVGQKPDHQTCGGTTVPRRSHSCPSHPVGGFRYE
jgi:transposase